MRQKLTHNEKNTFVDVQPESMSTRFHRIISDKCRFLRNKHDLFFCILLFVFMALVIPLILMNISVSTTPIAKQFYGYDMQVFITQGMFWTKGLIPYKDAFDHKGPLTFLIYAVGWMIHSKNGIFVLQCIALWISSIFAYVICKQFISNRYIALVGVISFWVCFALVIDEGGLCEEFNLPVLMISTYLIIRFSNSKFDEHPPRYAFVHGITVAASFCFRATNCIAICGAVFIITILLIKKQRYKNLIFNIIAFSFGFMIVFCPFLIYFALNKAVPDFMWGTFLYNFMYASEKVHHNSAEWQMICLYLSPVIGSAFLAIWEPKRFRSVIVFSSILTIIILVRCYFFPHYYIIALPFAPVSIGLLFRRGGNFTCDNWKCRTQIMGISAIIVICIFISAKSVSNIRAKAGWIQSLRECTDGRVYEQMVCDQISVIPAEDRDSVIAYNTDAKWYIASNILPCYKYYFYQEWQCSKSPQMREENEKFYRSLTAKWIIVGKYGVNNAVIQQVLTQHYDMQSTIHINEDNQEYDILLYHIKE